MADASEAPEVPETAESAPGAAPAAAAPAGNFFTNLIRAPLQAVGSFIAAPFAAILSIPGKIFGALGGAAKGVVSGIWSGVLYTGVISGLKILSPELWATVARATGGEAAVTRAANLAGEDGIAGIVVDSAKQGFGLAALIGGARGAFDGGGVLGGGVVMATVTAVALGALQRPSPTPGGTAVATTGAPAAKPKDLGA